MGLRVLDVVVVCYVLLLVLGSVMNPFYGNLSVPITKKVLKIMKVTQESKTFDFDIKNIQE